MPYAIPHNLMRTLGTTIETPQWHTCKHSSSFTPMQRRNQHPFLFNAVKQGSVIYGC
jgi:hypothetical protein